MTRRPFLIAILLLGTVLPLAPGAASGCSPGRVEGAAELSALGSTYYNLLYKDDVYTFEEVWHESNGIPGLQTSATMGCGKNDRNVERVCIGYCPIPL